MAANSDASIRRVKGPQRPVCPQTDRLQMLAALADVDYVIAFDDSTPHRLLEQIRPDILVKGGDYRPETIVGRELVESYGGEVKALGYVAGLSTTGHVQRVISLCGPHSTVLAADAVSEAG